LRSRLCGYAALLFALIGTLIVPVIFPQPKMQFFAPFLAFTIYQYPFEKAIGIGFCVGLLIDLLSPYTRMGLHASCFLLGTSALYGQKKNFFEDSLSTLPLFTFALSALITAAQVTLHTLFENYPLPKVIQLAQQVAFQPVLDGVCAFVLFTLPVLCFGKRPRKGSDYFVDRKLSRRG